MKKKKNAFINEFLKKGNTVGAIAPSSKFLAKRMVKNIDFNNADNIIEYGAGTGIVTRELLKNMNKNAKLLSFEINHEFLQKLSLIDDERFILINDSAENLGEYLKQQHITTVDYVVSSLPLAIIPEKVKKTIINESVKFLRENGRFIQFQYSLNAKKLLKKAFHEVRLSFIFVNIPPAFVYNCKKVNTSH